MLVPMVDEDMHRGARSVSSPKDVVILGGGLAGLCLARQLRKRMPSSTVTVIERTDLEVPVAAHKVGESTVEGGTHYLRKVLGLEDYVDRAHLPKLGLRFFGPSSKQFGERFEIGALDFPPVPSAQFDRGLLEADLRRFCIEDGVDLRLGAHVTEVDLGTGESPHVISIRDSSGTSEIRARWAIDATGRRRLFQQKLGLISRSPHHASACWWRQAGVHDLSQIVTDHPSWAQRTRQRRWLSTNHVLGRGYWIWLIPLSSNNTSVGIVTDERIHPVRERSTYSSMRRWLMHHEPELAAFLGDAPPMDFRALKEFAYTTEQAFSIDRWACVGEAAAFSDPLYSMGTDLIAWANTLVTNMIEADSNGALSPDVVTLYDRIFRSFVDGVFEWFRDSYHVFGDDEVALYKLLWDALHYFSFPGRALLHGALDSPERLRAYWASAERMASLNESVQELFRVWALREPVKVAPGLYHPFVSSPSTRLCVLGSKELEPQPSDEFLAEQEQRLERFEEIAAALAAVAGSSGVELGELEAASRTASPDIIAELRAFLSPLDVSKLPTSTQAIRDARRSDGA